MKYYVYVSDTKVDMLLAQIPPDWKKRVAIDLGFEINVLAAKVKGGAKTVDAVDNRFARLDAVLKYLGNQDMIGSVAEPRDFFEDKSQMKWGSVLTAEPSQAVFFARRTEDSVVLMYGSMSNVMGGGALASGDFSPSLPAYFTQRLLVQSTSDEVTGTANEPRPALSVDSALFIAAEVVDEYGGVFQVLEYVAKPYWYGNVDGCWVIVGSPLYVALA